MSYILDALKKSEQERSRGTIPDIKTVHQPRQVEYQKTSRWPYILLVVLLLNAGGLGFWVYQNKLQTGEDSRAGNDASVATTELPDLDSRAATQPAQKSALLTLQNPSSTDVAAKMGDNMHRAIVSPQQDLVEKSHTDLSAKEKSGARKPNVVFSDKPLTVSEQELQNAEVIEDLAALSDVKIVPQSASPVAETFESLDDRIYDIAELPESLKRSLPSISFAGHVYSSTQSQRSVMLNGKKMREGQEVTKGLVLEEITMEGVVLRSQGYRFKLGALQDWSFQ